MPENTFLIVLHFVNKERGVWATCMHSLNGSIQSGGVS